MRLNPVDEEFARSDWVPDGLRSRLLGETRRYHSRYSIDECRVLLQAVTGSPIVPQARMRFTGEIGGDRFAVQLVHITSGALLPADYAFGHWIPWDGGAAVTIRVAPVWQYLVPILGWIGLGLVFFLIGSARLLVGGFQSLEVFDIVLFSVLPLSSVFTWLSGVLTGDSERDRAVFSSIEEILELKPGTF